MIFFSDVLILLSGIRGLMFLGVFVNMILLVFKLKNVDICVISGIILWSIRVLWLCCFNLLFICREK